MTPEQAEKLNDIYSAFFDVPAGSAKGTKPLIEEVRSVTAAYRNASWFTRALIWFLPTAAMLGVSATTIYNWFKE